MFNSDQGMQDPALLLHPDSKPVTGKINGINGPIIDILGTTSFQASEMVYIGEEKLVGEVITLSKDKTIIQVFEETSGLKPGDPVIGTGRSLYATLAPGILDNIFDGIERPLKTISAINGAYINRGFSMDSLDTSKEWDTTITLSVGDTVFPGTVIATVPETASITHKVMIPPEISGTIIWTAENGKHKITDELIKIKTIDDQEMTFTMVQKWPIRIPRPVTERYAISQPLITGQRIMDSLFPLAKGGSAAIPGGFGTGKTMTQHSIAKWSDADIIVYIGCGERGNEMTEVLEDFSKLTDPKTGNPLMARTVLIANTSNMPVAAREASIYTGITLAEYYRDMGYHVAIMADSTSRWAEALREISGRLEEMPAEEGFPAYLASRLASFYERAGMIHNLNGTEGSVSIIGAVSPQGGDFSEPVTQNTKRFVGTFLGLDKSLAYARHFPAINWMNSYSDYISSLGEWYTENVDPRFLEYRSQILSILHEESSLLEIVKLIGSDVLPDDQKLSLEIAKVIRLGFLQQNAFHKEDASVPIEKQFLMMEVILHLFETSKKLIALGNPMRILKEDGIFEKVIAIKYDIPNDKPELLSAYLKDIDSFYTRVLEKNG